MKVIDRERERAGAFLLLTIYLLSDASKHNDYNCDAIYGFLTSVDVVELRAHTLFIHAQLFCAGARGICHLVTTMVLVVFGNAIVLL